jgi:hypothetical protein
MTFQDALNEVIANKVVVSRRIYYHAHDYGDYNKPWSQWLRIRLDDDPVSSDALIYFETRNFDETTQEWIGEWGEDNISQADIQAHDWEVVRVLP